MRMKIHAQASIILILLSAVAIIFFAISLNWGRISQIKTLTTVSATTAASSVASDYASYGQNVLEVQLDGSWQHCGWNSTFTAFLTAVAIIGLVALAVFCGGCTTGVLGFLVGLVPASGVAMGIAIGLAVAGAILSATVFQPGMDRKWNRQQANLAPAEQFLEQGLSSAIQGAVSDSSTITDYFDDNTNGVFGIDSVTHKPKDNISRVAFFYNERMKMLSKNDPNVNIDGFVSGLNTFLGALDVPCSAANAADPHCNPCCIVKDYNGKHPRPVDCKEDDADPIAPSPPECKDTSKWPYSKQFPLTYDATYPTFVDPSTVDPMAATPTIPQGSFLGKFGIDAGVRPFKKEDSKIIYRFLWDMKEMGDVTIHPEIKPLEKDLQQRKSDGAITPIDQYKANNNQCVAQLDTSKGFLWKEGIDLYCSAVWPYDICAKNNSTQCSNTSTSCGCTQATASEWPEDALDGLTSQLKQFYLWGTQFNQQALGNTQQLMSSLDQWYPTAAKWFGPKCTGSNDLVCYNDGANNAGGVLYALRDRLAPWRQMLSDWLNNPQFNLADNSAWCLPATEAGVPSADEKLAIKNAGGANGWGNIKSVVACLDWNKTNNARFNTCDTAVDAAIAKCPSLPSVCNMLPAGAATAFNNQCSIAHPPTGNSVSFYIGQAQDALNSEQNDLDAEQRVIKAMPDKVNIDCKCKDVACKCVGAVGNQVCETCQECETCQIDNPDKINAQATQDANQAAHNTSQSNLTSCNTITSAYTCPTLPPECNPNMQLPRSVLGTPPTFDPCDSPASQYKLWVENSAAAAIPQGTNFSTRSTFLKDMMRQALVSKSALDEGKAALDKFLCQTNECSNPNDGSAVQALIQSRETYKEHLDKLPNFITYGWRDDNPPKNSTRQYGYWHIVRVEAKVPGKCPALRPGDQSPCGTNRLPWVWSHDVDLGMRTCYEIKDYAGDVFIRVTRWDEDHDSAVFFNNNAPIWKFTFSKPGSAPASAENLNADCSNVQDKRIPPIGTGDTYAMLSKYWGSEFGNVTKNALSGAFMFNAVPTDASSSASKCWNEVNALLNRGVKTTTCANYYLPEKSKQSHMELRFKPCPSGVFDENSTTTGQ